MSPKPRISGEARRLQQLATEKLKRFHATGGNSRRDWRYMREAQALITTARRVDEQAEAA